MENVNYAVEMKALLGDISECGDIGIIKEYNSQCFIALIDVLGHGSEARKVALNAKAYIEGNYHKDLLDIMNGLHNYLTGSRGAVVSLCNFNIVTGKLSHVGIGNITVRVLGLKPSRLVSRDGIVGYGSIRPMIQEIMLIRGDTLLLHSDGITEHFDVVDCARLLKEDADEIVKGIINQFGVKKDDASCIALKYLK